MNSDPSPAAELAASHIDGALVICAGKIVYANEAARAIFGLPSEAVDGTLVAPLLGLGHASDVDGWLGERAGQPYEERLYRDSGEPFAARVGSVVLDAVEQRFGLSIQDMSEARAVADALEKELVALEASRMALIESKQSLIEALSLPILRVWDGVIAVPLIGPLDEARAADTLERLLDVVVASSARHVIIDLTGLVSANANSAAYLVTMIRTLGLVGSRCVLAGIRPALSTMFVDLELPLGGAECFSTQAEALAAVLGRLGWSLCRTTSRAGAKPGRSRL